MAWIFCGLLVICQLAIFLAFDYLSGGVRMTKKNTQAMMVVLGGHFITMVLAISMIVVSK